MISEVGSADSSLKSFPRLSTPPTRQCSDLDLDDVDDVDELDGDCLESLDHMQEILQSFGNRGSSASMMDYFDSCRYEIMYELMNIERQFEQLKTMLYDESVLYIDRKLLSIHNEDAPEYQDEVRKLHDEMVLRLEVAQQRRHIELNTLDNVSQSEIMSSDQTLQNDRALLFDHVREDLEEKINELERLRSQTELCATILQEMLPQERPSTPLTNKRRLDLEPPETQKRHGKKRRRNFGNASSKSIEKNRLAIFYQLSEAKVIEDWAVIQASTRQSLTISDVSDAERSDNDDDTSFTRRTAGKDELVL